MTYHMDYLTYCIYFSVPNHPACIKVQTDLDIEHQQVFRGEKATCEANLLEYVRVITFKHECTAAIVQSTGDNNFVLMIDQPGKLFQQR